MKNHITQLLHSFCEDLGFDLEQDNEASEKCDEYSDKIMRKTDYEKLKSEAEEAEHWKEDYLVCAKNHIALEKENKRFKEGIEYFEQRFREMELDENVDRSDEIRRCNELLEDQS